MLGEAHSTLPVINKKDPCPTSLQFFPSLTQKESSYSLIVGLDKGQLLIWSMSTESKEWKLMYKFHDYTAHGLTVRRIKFGAFTKQDDGKNNYTVATCGNDHTVRVFEIIY